MQETEDSCAWRGVVLGAAMSSALLLQACVVVGIDHAQPEVATPDGWTVAVGKQAQASDKALHAWWKGFGDPVLNALVRRTREANPDLEIAALRIAEARASRGVARSLLLPNATGEAAYSRNRASESLFVPPPENPSDLYAAGFDAGWEIDLFGGLRRKVEAAEAGIEVAVEDYRDLLVTLFAETALNYVEYRALEERLRLAAANVKAQAESAELTQTRLDAGLAPRIDATQAKTNLETTRSLLPVLRTQLAQARNRLATLTAMAPAEMEKTLRGGKGIPVPRRGFSSGLPCDLLRGRPDIRRAERELALQTALIGVAEADLYPRFTLFGNFALQSLDSSDLLRSASGVYSFGPALRWQIFSAGRIRNTIRIEEARAEQALSAYEKAVLRGVEEVETGMAAVANGWDRVAILQRAVDSSVETVELVKDNYQNGIVDFQRVLDAERSKFSSEDELAISRGEIARNYISLYKALGGGSDMEVIPEPQQRLRPGGGFFGFAGNKAEVSAGPATADGEGGDEVDPH